MTNGKGSARRPGKPGAYERGYDAITWLSKSKETRRLDQRGQPVCPSCGMVTNRHYALNPKLICWNCGASFAPLSMRC